MAGSTGLARFTWLTPASLLLALVLAATALRAPRNPETVPHSAAAPGESAQSRTIDDAQRPPQESGVDTEAASRPSTMAASRPARTSGRFDPLDLIPADCLVVWKGIPLPDEPAGGGVRQEGATFLELLRRVLGANLDARAKLTLRIYELISHARDTSFAFTCIDASARAKRADGGGTRADRLRMAFVADTRGEPKEFLAIVHRAVQELTDAGPATLERKTAGDYSYQELYDRRLPDWCRVAWGVLGDTFVLTLGEDVWPQIVEVAAGRQPAMSAEPWVRAARAETPNEPVVEIVASIGRIRSDLDPVVRNRATAFFESWACGDVDDMYWAIGFREAGLYCQASLRRGGETDTRLLADPSFRDAVAARTIPERARYAVFRVNVADVIRRVVASYYAMQGEEDLRAAERTWKDVQKKLGFDAQEQLLSRLGDTLILHNVPAHPLRIPLMFTALYEIDRDGRETAEGLERVCAAWLDALREHAATAGNPEPTILQRDEDGVWYLQLGPVAGLAWTFTDRYLVTSWSPTALREYLAGRADDDIGVRPAAH